MKMYTTVKAFLPCFLLGLLFSCQESPTESRQEEIAAEEISISWNGKVRLQELTPIFEGKDLAFKEFATAGKPGERRFFARLASEDLPVEFSIREDKGNNTFAFFLSPNGHHSGDGEDFIGLFFKNIPNYKAGTALFKYLPVKAWTKPVKIGRPEDLMAEDNQFFFWQYEDGLYAAAMPLGGKGYSASLGSEGALFGAKSLSLVDSMDEKDIPLMAIAFGEDPYVLVDKLFESGMKLMDREVNLRKNKTYPAQFEYLGWCTWNAFGHDLTTQKVMDGAKSFKDKGLEIPMLLIDDGWQQITGPNGRLKSFLADESKLPGGLKSLTQQLRSQYGTKHIGVWHTLNGYWSGIDKDSELGQAYADKLMPYVDKVTWTALEPDTFYIPTIKSAEGNAFYDNWYTYLRTQGIDFVKVDNQLITDRISKGQVPLFKAGEQLQENFQKAVSSHFDGGVFNCMNMTVDALYHYGSSAVARAVEDFFPDNETYDLQHGNAAVHVLCANYNSYWLGAMVWPDFDMFQTHHKDAVYHAISRAISGGPIYITDTPGMQNSDIIKALSYRDGRIIRADLPSRPTKDCLFQVQDSLPFKAFSYSNGVGLLGIWNAADADVVKGSFSPGDVHGISGPVALYDYFNKKAISTNAAEIFPLELNRMEYRLYYVAPLQQGAAVFGLVNKYNAPKTVDKLRISADAVSFTVPEEGNLAAYLAQKPKRVSVNGQESRFVWDKSGLLAVTIPSTGSTAAPHTIEIAR